MLAAMDAAQAIADLTEISPQVQDVVVVGGRRQRSPARTSPSDEAAQRLVDGARRLLVEAAERLRPGVAQLEAATPRGSVFVVRDGDRLIAATTRPEPTVGPRLLRPEDLPALGRRAGRRGRAETAASAEEGEGGRRCRRVSSSPACCSPQARSPARCSSAAAPRGSRERVDLYAEDGSMQSFAEGTPEAERLLPIARELLRPA